MSAFTIFFTAFLAWSEVFKHIIYSYIITVALTSLLFVGALLLERRKIRLEALFTLFIFEVFLLLVIADNPSPSFVILIFSSIVPFLLLGCFNFEDINKVQALSVFTLVLILGGAVLAYIFVALGSAPVASIPRFNSVQVFNLYPFSLASQEITGNWRFSGIYDEPGALAFVVASLLIIRRNLGVSKKNDLVILIMGLTTFSVAYAGFIACYLADSLKRQIDPRGGVASVKILASIPFILLFFVSLVSAIIFFDIGEIGVRVDYLLSSNFILFSDRFRTMANALHLVTTSEAFSVWSGIDYEVYASLAKKGFQAGENPIFPLLAYGLIISLPYYLSLFYLLSLGVRRADLLALFMFVLLLQRPYVLDFGYSTLIAMVLSSFYFATRKQEKPSS